MVSSLKGASGDWDSAIMHASFDPQDAEAILSILPFSRPDSLCWHFDKFGKFSVKSAYWLVSQNPFLASSSSQQPLSAW
ncbi:hypothetical protein ACOSQ4_022562 [Xanthoceras sorbifolium]